MVRLPTTFYLERQSRKIVLNKLDIDHFSSFKPKSQFSVYYLSTNRGYKAVGMGGFRGSVLCLF